MLTMKPPIDLLPLSAYRRQNDLLDHLRVLWQTNYPAPTRPEKALIYKHLRMVHESNQQDPMDYLRELANECWSGCYPSISIPFSTLMRLSEIPTQKAPVIHRSP